MDCWVPAIHGFFKILFKLYFTCVQLWESTRAIAYLWRSKGSLQKLLISFRFVGSGDQIQVVRLGGGRLYPLGRHTSPSHLCLPKLIPFGTKSAALTKYEQLRLPEQLVQLQNCRNAARCGSHGPAWRSSQSSWGLCSCDPRNICFAIQ